MEPDRLDVVEKGMSGDVVTERLVRYGAVAAAMSAVVV